MLTRIGVTLAALALFAGNALAGRACPSDAASGASTVCDKSTHAAHAAPSVHVTEAALAVPASLPAPAISPASATSPTHAISPARVRGATSPGCCSMPFSSAGDVMTSSGVTGANHSASAEAAHVAKATPAKAAPRQPQRSAVAPAFGPLFLAHQALML